jgi:antitoxin component YwqK of YwqJK toxin-antitoxin module
MEYTKIDGKLSDKITTYYKNGKVKTVQLVQAGKLGKKTKNTVEKKFNDEKVYKDENPPKTINPKTKGVRFIPSGYNTIYNENDEIWQDGNFKDGQLYDGKVYIYGSNGLLIKIKVFKEGKFHSLGQL